MTTDTSRTSTPKSTSEQFRDDPAEMTSLVEVMADTVASLKATSRRALAHHRALLAARDSEGR